MKRVTFVGSKALGLSMLREMYRLAPDSLCGIITIDDSQDTRCVLNNYKEFSEQTGKSLRVLQRSSELKTAIAEFLPDICIVVGWYWVLKSELLKLVPEGWLGIHASLLPKYRGGAPLVWSLINGDTESGLSFFYFDEGMDTGDIIAQKKFPIDSTETIADVLYKAELSALKMLQETYPKLLNGTAQPVLQDHSQATYVALRQPSDGRIDWHLPALRLYNFVRAQTHPYPGAFCFLPSGQTLRIWAAKVFPHPYFGIAGRVTRIDSDHVVVTCGDSSALYLYTVQIDGQPEQKANEVLTFGQQLQ